MKIICVDSRVNVNIFSSTSVPFILTTVQVPNLALTHKKWITVLEVMMGPRKKDVKTKEEAVRTRCTPPCTPILQTIQQSDGSSQELQGRKEVKEQFCHDRRGERGQQQLKPFQAVERREQKEREAGGHRDSRHWPPEGPPQ